MLWVTSRNVVPFVWLTCCIISKTVLADFVSRLPVGSSARIRAGFMAIARAIAMNPALILADEPTGNLATKSANTVFEMMQQVNQTNGTTFLLVTHNMDLARRCHRIVEVVDGRIVTPSPVRGST